MNEDIMDDKFREGNLVIHPFIRNTPPNNINIVSYLVKMENHKWNITFT